MLHEPRLEIRPMSDALGAEIRGLDLSHEIDDATPFGRWNA